MFEPECVGTLVRDSQRDDLYTPQSTSESERYVDVAAIPAIDGRDTTDRRVLADQLGRATGDVHRVVARSGSCGYHLDVEWLVILLNERDDLRTRARRT